MTRIAPVYIAIAMGIVVVLCGGLLYVSLRGGGDAAGVAQGANSDTAKRIDALTAAVEHGVITQQQYDTQVAALVNNTAADGSRLDNAASARNKAQKFDALTGALDSGLITREEYDAKVSALTNGADATAAQAAIQGTFQSFDNPGGGKIIIGVLGPQSSSQAAMGAVLRRIHAEFGNRPSVAQMASNPQASSIALFFTASKNGQSYTGMALANAVPGAQAGGAVLYDTTARFSSTIGPMMHQLQSATNPQANAGSAAPPAPPEPMEHHEFSDGSGSINVPADWRLTSGGGGSAGVIGPTGEFVGYNLDVGAMDPNNQSAQNYMRALPQQNLQFLMKQNVLIAPISDPVTALSEVFQKRAQQNGNRPPIFNVKSATPMAGGGQGYNAAEIVGEATVPNIPGKSDDEPGAFVAFVQVTPANGMGQWNLIDTMVYVPDSQFRRYGATAAAILGSVRINFGVVAAQSAAIRDMFQQKFDAMIANDQAQDAARQEGTDRAMARDRAAQEGMHRQAVGWENFALDRSVVVNTVTGVHSTIDNQFAGALMRDDPDYRAVPASEYLRGVDY